MVFVFVYILCFVFFFFQEYKKDMKFLFISLAVICVVLFLYICSGYNTRMFQVLNVMFFLSFILSLCAIYMQQYHFDTEKRSRQASIIVKQLYELESQDSPPPLQVLECLENIHYLEETRLLKENEMGKRFYKLLDQPSFRRFWKENNMLYSPQIHKMIATLMDQDRSM